MQNFIFRPGSLAAPLRPAASGCTLGRLLAVGVGRAQKSPRFHSVGASSSRSRSWPAGRRNRAPANWAHSGPLYGAARTGRLCASKQANTFRFLLSAQRFQAASVCSNCAPLCSALPNRFCRKQRRADEIFAQSARFGWPLLCGHSSRCDVRHAAHVLLIRHAPQARELDARRGQRVESNGASCSLVEAHACQCHSPAFARCGGAQKGGQN